MFWEGTGLDALTMVALWGSSSAVLFRLWSLIRNARAAGEVWESNDIDATILRIRGQHEHAPTRDRTGPGELSAPATRHVDGRRTRLSSHGAERARGPRSEV
jgi:hypothetical protein